MTVFFIVVGMSVVSLGLVVAAELKCKAQREEK